MGKLTLLDLIIYIVRFLWCVVELHLELLLYILGVTYEELSSMEWSTRIVLCFLLTGVIMMQLSPFHSQLGPRLYASPFELDKFQVHKPAMDSNDEWDQIHRERRENSSARNKEIVHFIVRHTSDTRDVRSMEANETRVKKEAERETTLPDPHYIEETSKDSLFRAYDGDGIEEIEKEILVLELNE